MATNLPDGAPVELLMIGGGNMGAALLGGLLAAGVPAGDLAVVELSSERRDWLAAEFPGVRVSPEVIACRAAVLAVKPPQIAAVAADAVAAGAGRLLSIAAGISTATIEAAMAPAIETAMGVGRVAVVRSMPNTPALVGRGVAAVTGGASATEEDLLWAEGILGGVGICVRLDEQTFDAVTAVTGSGPAYVFRFAEVLIAAAIAEGIPAEMADPMVRHLLSGSAELLMHGEDPARLREMVTSPGGTTAAGLAALDVGGFVTALTSAVTAAAARSRELGAG